LAGPTYQCDGIEAEPKDKGKDKGKVSLVLPSFKLPLPEREDELS
jgi:hypothetical protein